MMKKLNVSELRSSKRFYLLSDFEKRQFVGGGSGSPPPTWDCTFNAFVSYMGTQGYNVDKNELVNSYCSYYGTTAHELMHDGGISSASFNAFISHAYQINMTPQDSGPDSPDGLFPDNYTIYLATDTPNMFHIVRPLSIYRQNGILLLDLYDPTSGELRTIEASHISAFFTFDKKPEFGTPGYYGYPGDGNNPGYPGYGY